MQYSLYKFRGAISRIYGFRVLLVLLLSMMVFPPVWAQEQRRGVFLQDELPGQGTPGSFQGLGMQGQTGMDGVDEFGQPLGMQRRYGTSAGALRYQVHVLGEVVRPGTYRVSPSMRVTDALRLAGGIEVNGSERFVQLRKQGQKHGRALDLFAYKTLGEVSQNPYLQDNDTIFVPLKQRAVEIEGPVRRPGVYELKDEQTLYDLVTLAGGFSVGANKEDPLKVVRYGDNLEKEIFEIDDDPQEMREFYLKDGDVIVVEHKFLTKHSFDYNVKKLPNDNIFYPAFDDKVFVIGAVGRPGAFDFNQYYSLRQYLTLAGGTTIMAKRGKIKVVTVDGKTYKAKNAEYDRVVNPGDTIVVPEKSVPTAFYIGLLPTIASLGLSAAALFR